MSNALSPWTVLLRPPLPGVHPFQGHKGGLQKKGPCILYWILTELIYEIDTNIECLPSFTISGKDTLTSISGNISGLMIGNLANNSRDQI